MAAKVHSFSVSLAAGEAVTGGGACCGFTAWPARADGSIVRSRRLAPRPRDGHVRHPCLRVIRCYADREGARRRRGRPPIPSTGSARETDPDGDLFHEPEAHPKTAAAGAPPRPPYVTTTRRREATKSYKPPRLEAELDQGHRGSGNVLFGDHDVAVDDQFSCEFGNGGAPDMLDRDHRHTGGRHRIGVLVPQLLELPWPVGSYLTT